MEQQCTFIYTYDPISEDKSSVFKVPHDCVRCYLSISVLDLPTVIGTLGMHVLLLYGIFEKIRVSIP
jgi:hypothetical protein